MTQPATLLDIARQYWKAGLTPMPRVIGSQEPAYIDAHGTIFSLAWGQYKRKQPDWPTVESWFSYGDIATCGICLLTGSHPAPRKDGSAFPQVLDIETAEAFDNFRENLNFLGHADILHRCVIERTPGGGAHVGFLCRTIDPGQKVSLAKRDDGKMLIELLEHQPCTVSPTAIRCKPDHPDDASYTLVQGAWDHLQDLSTEQRQILLETARALNEKVEHVYKEKGGTRTTGEVRPGDHLNSLAEASWWTNLLTTHGWRDVSRPGLASRGIYYFQRPGKVGREPSATYGATGSYLYIFSSNAQPFSSDTGYSAFSAFALLEHGGNFQAAARALAAQYGLTQRATQQAAQHQNGQEHTTATPRAPIHISPDITRVVNEGQTALLALPDAPIIYQRARRLCIIARGVEPPLWLNRPRDTPIILEASPAHLHELAAQAALWQKYDKRTKSWEEALPPKWFVESLVGRGAWPFPVLEGLIGSPTLRPDGSLLDTPGYDKATGLFLDTNGTMFPAIPTRPSLDDARTALGDLYEVVSDFPFVNLHHRSTAFAAICYIVCRCAIRGCVPLFAIRATNAGTGKGLLADVVSLIGSGRTAPRWPQVSEADEERKRLLVLALEGYPVVHIDNVARVLGSPALDMALTASSFSDRILGKTESREAPLSMVLLASGNNMQFRGDTARRVLPVDLDAKMEKPAERSNFKHNPLLTWVQRERPRLAMRALTIVKAFFTAGCPAQDITAFGSFEAWSDIIRQALIWAGEADPCEGRKNLEAESDPQYEALATLLCAWDACYGSTGKTLNAAIGDIGQRATTTGPGNEWNALHEALIAFDRRYNSTAPLNAVAIANAFKPILGRVIELSGVSTRLIKAGHDRVNKTEWQIEKW